jgi:hypothetical protein
LSREQFSWEPYSAEPFAQDVRCTPSFPRGTEPWTRPFRKIEIAAIKAGIAAIARRNEADSGGVETVSGNHEKTQRQNYLLKSCKWTLIDEVLDVDRCRRGMVRFPQLAHRTKLDPICAHFGMPCADSLLIDRRRVPRKRRYGYFHERKEWQFRQNRVQFVMTFNIEYTDIRI